jgi:hypothetical protein
MASSSTSSLLTSEPLPWRPNTRPKLPPGALLDIADDLLYDIFTEYVQIEDMCRLDSALCQKSRRPEFLRLVSTKVLLFNREQINVMCPDILNTLTHNALGAAALNWILKRGIHLASVCLGDHGLESAEQAEAVYTALANLAYQGRLDKV